MLSKNAVSEPILNGILATTPTAAGSSDAAIHANQNSPSGLGYEKPIFRGKRASDIGLSLWVK